jgi:hypothetical protein
LSERIFHISEFISEKIETRLGVFDEPIGHSRSETKGSLQSLTSGGLVLFGHSAIITAGEGSENRINGGVLLTEHIEEFTGLYDFGLATAVDSVGTAEHIHIRNISGKASHPVAGELGSGELLKGIINSPAEGGGRGGRKSEILERESIHIRIFYYVVYLIGDTPQS